MGHFVGIDLGTTYSAVSTIDAYGKPTVLRNQYNEPLTPSVIYFKPDGSTLVGMEAKDMLLNGEEMVAMFFKRSMGNSDFQFHAYGKAYSAVDLSAILLRQLKEDAEASLGGAVTHAVITVPAYFNDLQRNETIQAAQKAGLEVLRIINEPTAAAICYGVSRDTYQRLLVYDLGGGTFDVTVLEIRNGSINVLATGGDHRLGGKDWDDRIINYIADMFLREFGIDLLDDILAYNDLSFNAEKLKKQLSSQHTASTFVRCAGYRQRYELTREKFEELTNSLLHTTQQKTEEVLREAGLTWRDLSGALLVGGSTKMPMVEEWVEKMSGRPPLRGINVDEAVCLGAAIQASLEMQRKPKTFGLAGETKQQHFFLAPGNKTVEVHDVMSHSLGAIAVSQEGDRYVNSIIIRKNLTIPISETRSFKHKTRPNDTNEMEVYLTQGEGTEVTQCTVVGKYIIKGISHVTGGSSVIDLRYSYDENGVINVAGYQQETRRQLQVEKVPLPDDMDWLYKKPQGKKVSLDIILAIDVSGSMEGKPLRNAADAAREFISKMDLDRTAISVIGFENKVHEYCSLTHSSIKLKLAITGLRPMGATYSPLKFALNKLHNSKNKPVIIVLTDGEWFDQPEAIDTSDLCRSMGIDIIAVGFGDADEKFLERISTISMMTDLDNLTDSFSSIAQELNQNGGTEVMRLHK